MAITLPIVTRRALSGGDRSSGPPEQPSRALARLRAVEDRRAAVDDDMLDPGRVPGRLQVCRVVRDRCRVEDDEIGQGSFAERPPIAQAETLGWDRGQLRDRR